MNKRSEIRDACIASLRAARLRCQNANDYVPATEAGALLERFGSAWAALEHAKRIVHTLEAVELEEKQPALEAVELEEKQPADAGDVDQETTTGT